MLYYLTTVVNRHVEFRIAFNKDNELGIYDKCYLAILYFIKIQKLFLIFGQSIVKIMNNFTKRMKTIFANMVIKKVCLENQMFLIIVLLCQ